ncbi:hypothetical protein GO730_00210 [Spirosoma sp. HMF3257]|uniref:hypothetical protein n=1 Tax=Spirosoma telluris TaxID=2183553 RepID=UPI0012FC679A|nr:hypothetical protein [Spirosoma telluris]
MPNTNVTGEGAWGRHWVSVDEMEKQTGYDLLSNVPENVQRVVEAGIDKINI